MSILIWITFGLVAAVIAHLLLPDADVSSFLTTLVLSVLGAILGGFLANLMLGMEPNSFSLISLTVAAVGSILLIVIPKLTSRRG